jgi:small conductance mechanosensitive channel
MFNLSADQVSSVLTIQRIVVVLGTFLLAYLIHLLSNRLSRRVVKLQRFALWEPRSGPERQATLVSLISGLISFGAFAAAILVSLGWFIGLTNLVWIVGLFSAAFGLGARPLVGDFLSGISFIFEDTFGVGEKVEIPVMGQNVEGIIEAVNLRTTLIRSSTGELSTIPNGEVRVVRNYSRGKFSRADITFRVPADVLSQAIPVLEELGVEAASTLPNLLEPWQVVSASDQVGQYAELTLITKARFGHAAEMRPRLIAFVQKCLAEAGITIEG